MRQKGRQRPDSSFISMFSSLANLRNLQDSEGMVFFKIGRDDLIRLLPKDYQGCFSPRERTREAIGRLREEESMPSGTGGSRTFFCWLLSQDPSPYPAPLPLPTLKAEGNMSSIILPPTFRLQNSINFAPRFTQKFYEMEENVAPSLMDLFLTEMTVTYANLPTVTWSVTFVCNVSASPHSFQSPKLFDSKLSALPMLPHSIKSVFSYLEMKSGCLNPEHRSL